MDTNRETNSAKSPTRTGDSAQTAFKLRAKLPDRDTWVGYHRDLKRLARLRALLDLVIEWLVNR